MKHIIIILLLIPSLIFAQDDTIIVKLRLPTAAGVDSAALYKRQVDTAWLNTTKDTIFFTINDDLRFMTGFNIHLSAATFTGTTLSLTLNTGQTISTTVNPADSPEVDPVVAAINGLIKSNGSVISAAVAGTDYITPAGSETLTNKTINADNNTITNLIYHPTISFADLTTTPQVMLFRSGASGATAVDGLVRIRGTSPSVTYAIHYGSTYGTSAGTVVASNTVTTSGTITINTSAIPANNDAWISITAVSGTITEFTFSLNYKQ